jgi:multidrug efflux pump subunit AcrA (membrane-fusion protein)
VNSLWQLPLVGLVFLLTACRQQEAATPPPPLPKVTVSQPVARHVVESDTYTGRLEAVESVDVRARVNGYLQSVNFTDGAIVKKGALLFVIDPRPYQSEPNPDLTLIPGLFARIRLPGSSQYKALLIPDEAIGTDQTQRFAFVVND